MTTHLRVGVGCEVGYDLVGCYALADCALNGGFCEFAGDQVGVSTAQGDEEG